MNQDACYAFCPKENTCFGIVCDGMGGEKAGDVASRMAMELVVGRARDAWRENMTDQSAEYLLLTALSAANICVYDEARENPDCQGMGTTAVACAVVEFKTGDGEDTRTVKKYVIAHAGDSRAYVYRGGELRQLTRDHSWVQEQVELGYITPEQARSHPRKNLITRAIGAYERIKLDITSYDRVGDERILLCSDGLSNFVEDARIAEIMRDAEIDEIPRRLVYEANANGGGDNIAAVVISHD